MHLNTDEFQLCVMVGETNGNTAPIELPRERHTVHWFRKGLRLHDNPAICEGLKGAVTFRCIFVIDPWFAGSSNVGINKWRWVFDVVLFLTLTNIMIWLRNVKLTICLLFVAMNMRPGGLLRCHTERDHQWSIQLVLFEAMRRLYTFSKNSTQIL